MKKIYPTEFQEACRLMQWAELHPICKHDLIHIPNGGKRDPKEAKNLQRQGVKKGVPDYFLPYPVPSSSGLPYYGLWLELKRLGHISRPTPDQIKWISRMKKRGYSANIAYGANQAIEIIEMYLIGKL